MARRHLPSVPLSNMRGGVNRLIGEASPVAIVDGENVIVDDGELRRRDAMRSFATAAPHLLPSGFTIVKALVSASVAAVVDRTFTGIQTVTEVYVGHSGEQFDGLLWREKLLSGLSGNIHINVYYGSTGNTWTAMPWWLDRTKRHVAASNANSSLAGKGRITWHTAEFTSTWVTSAVDGATRYWVKLEILDGDDASASLVPNHYEPGIEVFQLERCNGIFPVTIKGRRQIILGSDRQTLRGVEAGAQLALLENPIRGSKPIMLREDEGAGVWDVQTKPGWSNGGSTSTAGSTADKLTKGRVDYSWRSNQHKGGVLVEITAVTGATSAKITTTDPVADRTNQWEHCKLRVQAKGAGGAPLGEERLIYDTEASGIVYFADPFSVTPDTDNDFDIRSPNSRLVIRGADEESFEIESNNANALGVVEGRPYSPDVPAAWDGIPLHWFIAQKLRWKVRSGLRWSATVDTWTRHLVMTNGHIMLEYDGEIAREMVADRTSQWARNYAGDLAGDGPDQELLRGLAIAQLDSKVPVGKFVVTYQSRLVVAGFSDNVHRIRYSAPFVTNVWPGQFEVNIYDREGDPIRGLATLHNKLVVFTATSIHECTGPTPDGFLVFRPISVGVGFISHHAVAQYGHRGTSGLIGPTPDGVYLYTGSEPTELLDDWTRLLEGGVNEGRLHESVGTSMPQKGWYVLAVPSRGSASLDKLIIFDWVDGTWWVWDAPHGVSALATDTDAKGQERLLIGTNDGHVATLVNDTTDDGVTITGHAKSAWIQAFGGREESLVAVLMTAKALSGGTMDLDLFINRRSGPAQEATLYIDEGSSRYGTATYTTGDDVGVFVDDGMKTARINVRSGTRADQVAIKVSGSARWRYKQAEIIAKPMSRRGRR